MRSAIYARVSTEDQAKEGFSLEAQLEKLRAYCNARGWGVAGEYVDDGYSGRDERRPAYRRMMEERDRWDNVLVMRMDRIHRNSRNFMEMMERLRAWGKEFTSMQESLDTATAMGRFVMDIIQRIAQLESEQIAERVYTGMSQKAKSGQGSLGSPAPFGYRYVEGALQIEDGEAEIVRNVFTRHLQGEPMTWIADDLNVRGFTTRKSADWSVWSIRYLLQNPVYAGYLYWDGILQKGEHESLIERGELIKSLKSFLGRVRSPDKRSRLMGLLSQIKRS